MNNYLIAFKDKMVITVPADRGEETENCLRLYVGDDVVFFVHLDDVLYVLRQTDHTNLDEILSYSPTFTPGKINYSSVNGRNPGEKKKNKVGGL